MTLFGGVAVYCRLLYMYYTCIPLEVQYMHYIPFISLPFGLCIDIKQRHIHVSV